MILAGVSLLRGSPFVPQPIIPLDLPVRVRSWELTVYPRSHIRRWLGSGSGKARGRWPFLGGPVVQAALTHYCGAISEKSRVPEVQASREQRLLVGLNTRTPNLPNPRTSMQGGGARGVLHVPGLSPSSPRSDRPFCRRPDLVRGAVGGRTFGSARWCAEARRYGLSTEAADSVQGDRPPIRAECRPRRSGQRSFGPRRRGRNHPGDRRCASRSRLAAGRSRPRSGAQPG